MAELELYADLDLKGTARLKNLPAPAAPNDAARLVDVGGGGLTIGKAIAVRQNLPLM